MHHDASRLNAVALSATVHCLTGCAIGEVLGMVIGSATGMANGPTVVLSILLAFMFGYALTSLPLLRAGVPPLTVIPLAFASDTVSITVMEIVDNAIILAVPGAIDAGLDSLLFWGSLAGALVVAGVVAYPVNRWLIARGKGHAVMHDHGAHGDGGLGSPGDAAGGDHDLHHDDRARGAHRGDQPRPGVS
jgi:uncharacterized protein DUF4396